MVSIWFKRFSILLGLFTLLAVSACDKGQRASHVPPIGQKVDLAKGKNLFIKNCSSCHGQDLKGSKVGPPLLHQYYESSHHGDMAFYMAAKNGVRAHHWQFGDMPAIPTVTGEDMGHIVAFIRDEQRKVGIH